MRGLVGFGWMLCACTGAAPDLPQPDAAVLIDGGDAGGRKLFVLHDSLRGGTMGAASGGMFGANGWTVTARTDRIWYGLPRLTEGSIELTVTNMSNANLKLSDNEIMAMYEDGYGITEPIAYDPYYRDNHYKVLLRIFGSGEPARVGRQKLVWDLCPSGAPGYGTCGCGSFGAEPYGGDGTWSGAAERLRVEWSNGVTRYLRNGSVVLTIDWSASGLTFGPESLHFSIGTVRPEAIAEAELPIGAVFSDLAIEGYDGRAASCP